MGVRNKVLIVDDDKEFYSLMKEALSRKGYDVFTAPTAKEARDLYKEYRPSVVLLDKRLPDIDGQELHRSLRKISKEASFIMVTGHSSVESAVRGFREGIVDYVQKPAVFDDIVNRVEKAFREQKKKDANQKKLEKLRRLEEYRREALERE